MILDGYGLNDKVEGNAPNNGNTSQANTPCSSQKLSQLHSFTFFIGTYELDWQKLPMAMMINPIMISIVYILLGYNYVPGRGST